MGRKYENTRETLIDALTQCLPFMEWSTRIYKVYLKYIAPEDIHIYSIVEE